MISNKNVGECSPIFSCKKCHYNTVKKFNYDKHVLTAKHQKSIGINENVGECSKSSKFLHKCKNCEKIYKDPSGLWRHNKKCISTSEVIFDKEFVMMLIKQNNKLQTQMMEIIKNGTHNTNNTNSHNKTFNMHFFLNETCKGAMNIMDFVNSIKVELSDLEKVGKIGYVEGISSIITNNLKALDITQRPIHCTDTKRETLYVKDENKWEKETEEKNKIRKAIKMVANKNIKMLPKFKEVHPDCIKSESKYSNQYNKLVIESFGGDGDDVEKESKIIKNISSVTTIEKEAL